MFGEVELGDVVGGVTEGSMGRLALSWLSGRQSMPLCELLMMTPGALASILRTALSTRWCCAILGVPWHRLVSRAKWAVVLAVSVMVVLPVFLVLVWTCVVLLWVLGMIPSVQVWVLLLMCRPLLCVVTVLLKVLPILGGGCMPRKPILPIRKNDCSILFLFGPRCL